MFDTPDCSEFLCIFIESVSIISRPSSLFVAMWSYFRLA